MEDTIEVQQYVIFYPVYILLSFVYSCQYIVAVHYNCVTAYLFGHLYRSLAIAFTAN